MGTEYSSAGADAAATAEARRERQIGIPVLPPVTALIEIALFFIPVTLVEVFEPTLLDVSSWQPHPFWFPVLLLSLQYGTVSGLLTAGIAIAVSVFFGFPEQEVGENHFSYLLRIWLQPVLWIAVAVVLGQFRLRQMSERAELQQGLDEARSQGKVLAQHADDYRLRCERLERGLASREPTHARALVDNLLDLHAADAATVGEVCLDCIALVAPGAEASCYLVSPEGLSLIGHRGSLTVEQIGRRFETGSPVHRAIVGEARALSVLAAADAAVLGAAGLVAVPILAPAGDRVLGMLKIDFAPAGTLSKDLADRLALVAFQAAPAIGNLLATLPSAAAIRVERARIVASKATGRRRTAWLRAPRLTEDRVGAGTTARSAQPRTQA